MKWKKQPTNRNNNKYSNKTKSSVMDKDRTVIGTWKRETKNKGGNRDGENKCSLPLQAQVQAQEKAQQQVQAHAQEHDQEQEQA
jgi:hypothetical protein